LAPFIAMDLRGWIFFEDFFDAFFFMVEWGMN